MTIVKDAVPDQATDFIFARNFGSGTAFILDDDAPPPTPCRYRGRRLS